MAYQFPLNGGRINATIGGNTAGVGSLVSTGTLTLVGGNNVTLSQAGGNAITISAGGGGSVNFSAGTTSNNLAALTFANSNGIGFGLSGSTITASHNALTSQSVQTQQNIQALVGGTATSTASTGTVTFANSNGVTFGMSGNTMTASVAAGGGGGIAAANSQTTYTSGTVRFVEGSGAITINSSTNGASQSLRFNVPAVSSLSATGALSISTNGSTVSIGVPMFSGGISNIGNTSGTTGTASNQIIFAGGNNITLSQSTGAGGNTITISGAAGGGGMTYSYFSPQDAYAQVTGQHGQGTLHMQPSKVPNVHFDRIAMPIYFTNSSNSTASVSLSVWFGVYTRTSDSFSLGSSISMSTNWTGSGTANASQLHGIRLLTLGWTGTILENEYYFGIISRSTTGGANATLQQLVASQQSSAFSGIMGVASNASIQFTRGLGYYSASTTALPGTIAMSQLRGNSSMVLRQPLFYFVNSTY